MKKKLPLIFFLLIALTAIGFIVYIYAKDYIANRNNKNISYEVKESITIESGEEMPPIKDYFKGEYPANANIRYYNHGVDVTESDSVIYYKKGAVKYSLGTYEIDVEIVGSVIYKSKLIVKDETAPKVSLKKRTFQSFTPYEAKDFVDEYEDNSGKDDFTAEFMGNKYEEPGTYNVTIKICDFSNNCVEQLVEVEIVPGETKVGTYKLTYGKYVGEICDENTEVRNCQTSVIFVRGDKIRLNDGTEKKYITDGNNLILSNQEVFRVIADNKLEYQNSLKSIYVYTE